MLVNSLNQTKSSFSHVFAHENDEITAIYGGLNYSNVIYYAYDTVNGEPPLSFKSNGESIEDYVNSGNSVQNGIPTTTSPIDVVGCGELIDGKYIIPVSCGGTTTNIDLSTTPTTRQIKKIIFTGQEDFTVVSTEAATTYFRYIVDSSTTDFVLYGGIGLCTHFERVAITTSTTNIGFSPSRSSTYGSILAFRPPNAGSTTVQQFKTWLANQYANGTPVTVWYLMTEPEITTLNEPLHKLSNTSDTVSYTQSGIAIPTINGTNTLTTTTTVLPSNIEATGRIKRTAGNRLSFSKIQKKGEDLKALEIEYEE